MSWDNMTWNKVTVEGNDQILGRMYAKVWIQEKSRPGGGGGGGGGGPKINFF